MSTSAPRNVGGGQRWLSITLGDYRACALRMDQSLWCTGFEYGGLPNFAAGYLTRVVGAVSDQWRQVAANICALKLDRTIWCESWSPTTYNAIHVAQIGTDSDWESLNFSQSLGLVSGLCAIKTNGSLWCFDGNEFKPLDNSNDWHAFSSDGGCAVKVNGSVYCYTLDEHPAVTTNNDWLQISPGRHGVACGLKINNTLWCWGIDYYGQFGNSTTTVASPNSPVAVQNASTWTAVSAGAHHTCAIAINDVIEANQRLHCWGNNSYGQLGTGSTTPISTPAPIDPDSHWLAVATGAYHTCGIKLVGATTSGDLWCWGSNGYGQLGAGYPDQKNVPTPVDEGGNWIAVAVGDNHSCALKNDNSLWCWGFNTYGQVGNGKNDIQSTPVQIDPATQWKLVTTGSNHTCAITVDSALRCWGLNESGQLGIDSLVNSLVPVPVKADPVRLWSAVATGAKHTCATSNRDLWCWGDNSSGQLAHGNGPSRRTPGMSRKSIKSFSTGYSHTCIEYIEAYPPEILCAGDNTHGQLGIENPYPQPAPVPISGQHFMYMHYLNALVSGANHTCALRNDNYLWCWGDNTDGQVGNGQ